MTDWSGIRVAKIDVCWHQEMNNVLFSSVEYLRSLNIHETRETFRCDNTNLREA